MTLSSINYFNNNPIKEDFLNTSLRTPPYYHRQFKNDIDVAGPKSELFDQTKRVALVALPFISLYKPCGRILSLTMDTMRTISCISQLNFNSSKKELAFALLSTAFAVTALAYNIFSHPSALLITTIHDLGINVNALIKAVNEKDSKKCLEITGQIINNLLYLALFTTGSLEILVISMLTQIMLSAYNSYDEFKNDHYLEALGHLLMSGIRCQQLSPQLKALQFKWNISKSVLNNQIELPKIRWEQFTDEQLLERAKADGNQELVDIIQKYHKVPFRYEPALYNALEKRDYAAVDMLMLYNAKVEYHTIYPNPLPIDLTFYHPHALDIALQDRNIPYSIVEKMIINGANIKINVDPIGIAVEAYRKDLVDLFLRCGANPNLKTWFGINPMPGMTRGPQTALSYIIESNDRRKYPIIKLLLEAGANPNENRAFYIASEKVCLGQGKRKDFAVVNEMLKHGADMDQSTIVGQVFVTDLVKYDTPLQLAVRRHSDHLNPDSRLLNLFNKFLTSQRSGSL